MAGAWRPRRKRLLVAAAGLRIWAARGQWRLPPLLLKACIATGQTC